MRTSSCQFPALRQRMRFLARLKEHATNLLSPTTRCGDLPRIESFSIDLAVQAVAATLRLSKRFVFYPFFLPGSSKTGHILAYHS